MMTRRKRSLLNYKLRNIFSVLGLFVLIFNIVGYLRGFLVVDFRIQYSKSRNINWLDDVRQNDADKGRSTYLHDQSEALLLVMSQNADTITSLNSQQQLGLFREISRTTPATVVSEHNLTNTPLSHSVKQHHEPCVYSKDRAVNDGKWYNFSVSSYTLYAYTAFVDDRESLLSEPVIRIIGLGSKPKTDDDRISRQLFCSLHYLGKQPVYVKMNPTAVKIGQGWVVNNEWIREYIFSCPLPQSKIPRAVTIVGSPGDSVTSCMPVEVPIKVEKKQDFALCVQVGFGKVDPYRLTEWLELQRLLGVRRVGVYSFNLDIASLDILMPYVTERFVELRKSDYIEHGTQQYLLHGTPVINDCLYRSIHQFHYVIVIDFDEVIMPKNQRSFRQLVDVLLLKYSSMTDPPANYIFYNNFFFLDLPPDISESPYLTMLRYRMKVPVSPFGYSVKSIVDTQACLAMHNHYCWTLTAEFANRSYPHVVDHTIAVAQHYKKCHLSEAECRDLLSQATRDDTILKFRTELKKRVSEKIFKLRGHNI